MYRVVDVGGVTLLEWVLLVLFGANFSWIALSFASAVVGFVWLLFLAPRVPDLPAALSARTAIVMPIYNEATARVFGAVQAICEDVARTGLGDSFDYFLLSDTTDPDVWIAEERAFLALRERMAGQAPHLLPASREEHEPQGRQHRRFRDPLGRRSTTTWSCSTPTA